MRYASVLVMLLLTAIAGAHTASAQGSQNANTIASAPAAPFLGTWAVEMTSPAELRGARETLTLADDQGLLAATLQVGRFPPQPITGAHRDGDLLILSTTLRENGQPIWVVLTLRRDGDALQVAQSMEQSETIKRGVGRKAS